MDTNKLFIRRLFFPQVAIIAAFLGRVRLGIGLGHWQEIEILIRAKL